MIVQKTENFIYFEVVSGGVEHHNDHIIQRISSLNLENKFVFFLNVKHVVNGLECEPLTKVLIKQMKKESDKKNFKFYLVIEDLYEAPSYRYNLKTYIDDITNSCNINLNDVIIWSGALHQFNDEIKYSVSYDMASPGPLLDGTNPYSMPEFHFISLAKIAKPHRIISTVEILDRGLDKFGNLSLGCGYYVEEEENNFDLVPERYRHKMPMILDEPLIGITHDGEFSAKDRRISHAFINLVQETSYDHGIHNGRWNLPFVTEKTIKPFAWGQVPIFIAPQNTVNYIKNLGYDLFDDLIDHSYSYESDPIQRIKKAINELERLCKVDLEFYKKYKVKNIRRFMRNRDIVNSFNAIYETNKNLQKALDT